jgi:phage terminase large subunit-like protein
MAAYDLLNVDLAPIQRVIFRDLWFKEFIILVAGRGCGKTFLLSLLATLKALLYPATRIGYISATFRQSKNVFLETERLYDKSSIFREACSKTPTKASDSCYIKFRAPKDGIGSWIEALPLGDGSKIRGSRFHILCLDEFPHIPSDIYDLVIRPMGATVMNPMENVRRIERIKRLKAMGIDTSSLSDGPVANKIIIASSGYFKFNHMWKRMKEYWRFMKEGNDKYAVHQVAYHEMPEGFLNEAQLEDAMRGMSSLQFTMEYGGLMVSDSDGLFKASLLEACSRSSLFAPEIKGDKGKEYIMGVDPARTADAFAITVIELGSPNKLIFAQEVYKYSFQQATELVRRVFKRYNIIRIFMDSQGGGLMIRDLLQVPDVDGLAIIERDKSNLGIKGLPLLELINPTNQNITDANYAALALLEDRDIWFPGPPLKDLQNKEDAVELSKVEQAYEAAEELKKQMLNIRITETRTGLLHFDTPAKGQRKDLYSAFILACYGINKLKREGLEIRERQQLAAGIITPVSEIPRFGFQDKTVFAGGALSEASRRKK